MREHNIVHCDLKPENILLRKINKSGIKIIDFGSGCFENEKIYTYIQSRFYRAPEIVLGIPYNAAIDMWSFGCILYELYVGHPLFPGEDEKDHMALMMEVKGVPPRSVLARATRRKVFFDEDYRPIIVPNSKGKLRVPNSKNLPDLVNSSDPDFVDFIDVSLVYFPFYYEFSILAILAILSSLALSYFCLCWCVWADRISFFEGCIFVTTIGPVLQKTEYLTVNFGLDRFKSTVVPFEDEIS